MWIYLSLPGESIMKLKQSPIGIGHNIKELRLKAGYSQSELVRELQLLGLNISYDMYKKIEQNKYNIRITELIGLKYILGVSYEEFFKGLDLDSIH